MHTASPADASAAPTPGPRYTELRLEISQAELDAVSDALSAAGALSVSLEDADADAPDEQAVYGEPGITPARLGWQNTVLTALFDSETQARQGLAAACLLLPALNERASSFRPVEDQDWVALTQAQFEPFEIPGQLWVGPSWLTPPAGLRHIILDPGSAFGTGSHPTTQLCLQWLMANTPVNASVLDYGCGTGVLALGALHAGAAHVIGVDIDPIAVRTALSNASDNQVAARCQFCLPEDLPFETQFDVVVANILARPLQTLAPLLMQHVRPGGSLILAGLLEIQTEEVAACYAPTIPMQAWRCQDGWALLAGQRPIA